MPTSSRGDRREERRARFDALFGKSADAALDLLELTELAWHDCYGDVSPPDGVIEDILAVSEGRIDLLARSARLAVEDFRDLRVQADAVRGSRCR